MPFVKLPDVKRTDSDEIVESFKVRHSKMANTVTISSAEGLTQGLTTLSAEQVKWAYMVLAAGLFFLFRTIKNKFHRG